MEGGDVGEAVDKPGVGDEEWEFMKGLLYWLRPIVVALGWHKIKSLGILLNLNCIQIPTASEICSGNCVRRNCFGNGVNDSGVLTWKLIVAEFAFEMLLYTKA